jgi:glycerophosphoryl diester phosphodiesterase
LSRPLVIGHRGAKGHVAENTLASFEMAIALGAAGVEFDVHLSADGEIIVIHDETVNRVTGGEGEVCGLTLAEIKSLRIGGVHEIPTLAETLGFLPRDCIVNIELKTGAAAKPVCHLLKQTGAGNYDRFIVSSFDWVALKEIRSHFPEIPIGVLAETDPELALAFALSVKAETLHLHFLLVDENIVAKAKRSGIGIFAWTVNRPQDLERLQNLHVSGIITDYPDRAK